MKDTILLYHIDLLKNDPGDFHRIKINLANGYCLDKINIGGWKKNIHFKTEKNEIFSNYVTIEKYEDFVFVMCFGYNYASTPGFLTIWDFSKEKPRIIFNQPFLLKEFIGKKNTVLSGYKFYQEAGSETVPEEYVLQINDEQLQLKKKSENIQ